MTFRSEALDPSRHQLDALNSGEVDLDTWLREHAAGAEARRVARTFVWCAADENVVMGYYSLAGHRLIREELPKSIGRGSPREVPAVLLARLAIDVRLQGRGLGGALLADALSRVVAATDLVAARFVVVDALNESAAMFYEHHGFRRIPTALRLVQKISDVAAALE
ncbi:MAG: GNAT family N-acetyltransferase [Geodermatophilaceae bacterium]